MAKRQYIEKEGINLIIVGLGGTGSRLYSPVCQYLSYLDEYEIKKVTLVDGDNFESKNFIRQYAMAHHTKINKAVAAADLLNLQFPELTENIKVVEDYLKNLRYHLTSNCLNLVISCVDNLKSRNLQIIDILNSNSTVNTLYITPGNELSDGQVISFLKFNDKVYGDNPLEQWENWNNPTDRIPR